MVSICLFFETFELKYADKVYAYKKMSVFCNDLFV